MDKKLKEMTCPDCGKLMSLKKSEFSMTFIATGKIILPDIQFFECCGEKWLIPGESLKFDKAYNEKIENTLRSLPFNSFADSKEVCRILSISKQALSKSIKYKRLIFQFTDAGRVFYLKKSVEKFVHENDGIFPISENTPIEETQFKIMRNNSSKQKAVHH